MNQRPMFEQISVVKNMVKVLGTLFKNEPMVESTSFVYDDGYVVMRLNEYEIWWEDVVEQPKEFTIYVEKWTPGTYWEPPNCDVVELGRTETLYAAILYVAQHGVQQVYNQFMEGEAEYQMDKELEAEYNKVEEDQEGYWRMEAGKYAYACGYHD